MNKFVSLTLTLGVALLLTVGCDTGPTVAPDADARQSMDDTMSFDPMTSTQPEGRPATP